MEMTSRAFRDALAELLSQPRDCNATVKYGSHYPEVERASGLPRSELESLERHRDEVMQRITSLVDEWTDRTSPVEGLRRGRCGTWSLIGPWSSRG